jgi:hypothetical protein
MGSIRLFAVLVVTLLAPAVLRGDTSLAPRSTPALQLSVLDLGGHPWELGQNDERRIRVFVFLGTECPVSNASTTTLNQLFERFGRGQGRVDFFGVVSQPDMTRSAAKRHFEEFRAQFPVLFDGSALLAQALGPTHVPEAFVLDRDGRLAYRGAVNDAWLELGRRRPNAKRSFLADAVTAALGGNPPPIERTKPVGCLVERHEAPEASGTITYSRDVAPILQARCMNCHREGQVAPFPLTTYEHAAKRAGQIARVTHDRIMPPWIPSPGGEKFVGERWLSGREMALLESWAKTGRTKGDAADLPPPPQFADGWRLGKPDLVLRMAEPFTVPADGPDVLQNFVIPIEIPEDKLVAAVEFHPGNKRVAHHSVLFLDSGGAAREFDRATPEPGYGKFGGPGFLPSGALGGWSVGNTPRRLPGGMGRYLKKSSDLVMQMHYHPSGKSEEDQSEVGLYFVDRPVAEVLKEPAKLVGSIWMANYAMDIPAGEAHYRRTTSYRLPKDVIMVGVVPHMHLLGKTMKVTANLPDGLVKTLIEIANWNYNWQDEYYYERPFRLPAGTRLDVEAAFDNSEGNPSNPSAPPRRVTWGDGTLDEMLFCFFLITSEKTEDLIHVVFDNLGHDSRQPRKAIANDREAKK